MLGRRTVALIGLRRAGKSTVGAALARHLELPFLDTDRLVEERTGRTCAEIITAEGLPRFREHEVAALDQALARGAVVLATGGGLIETPRARTRLREQCRTLWLRISPEAAAARTAGRDEGRPRLEGADDAVEEGRRLLARRSPLYAETADRAVEADAPPEVVLQRCLLALEALEPPSRPLRD